VRLLVRSRSLFPNRAQYFWGSGRRYILPAQIVDITESFL
jgi:hypothetical protein